MRRIAILCSFNLSLLSRRLTARLGALGIEVECYVTPFGQHYRASLDASSELYAFKPDIVIMFVDAEDALAEHLTSPLDLDPSKRVEVADRVIGDIASCVVSLRSRLSRASILVHNFCLSSRPVTGVLDANSEHSVEMLVLLLNERLHRLRAETPFTVVDYEGFVRRYGWSNLVDPRLWYHARMRLGAAGLDRLAELYSQYVSGLCGRTKKCLVCDLDNTLWGGVVGEVGLDGIELSEDGRGRAYKDFQREIAALRKSGVLLTVNSKNDLEDIRAVFEKHPEMVLRLDDFNAFRVNWNDKATNMREIAAELGIGLDSMVFVDDSPVECEWIRRALPEVTVVELPEDPAEYPGLLHGLPWFQRISLSEEDRLRADMVNQERHRQEIQKQFSSQEDFLRSLDMVAEMVRLDERMVTRAAQLTQRTNQFNLTDRRYSEIEIAAMAEDPRYTSLLVRVKDRFGDNGVVGLAIARSEGPDWELDTFLLSCRVIGRGVETTLLGGMARLAREHSVRRLLGRYIRTNRNHLAGRFLPAHGFVPTEEDGVLALDLETGEIAPPDWIAIKWS